MTSNWSFPRRIVVSNKNALPFCIQAVPFFVPAKPIKWHRINVICQLLGWSNLNAWVISHYLCFFFQRRAIYATKKKSTKKNELSNFCPVCRHPASHTHIHTRSPHVPTTLVARKLNSVGHFKIFKTATASRGPKPSKAPMLRSAFAGNYLSVCPFHGPHLGHATPIPIPLRLPPNPTIVDEKWKWHQQQHETSSQPVS